MTYQLILQKRDFAVHTAESSLKAIELLKHNPYDLLLCDYSLEQEHTGFEVIDAARRANPGIAAVLLTGYASKETVDRAQSDNVTVLFKPIDIEEFFRTVENLKRGKDAQTSQQDCEDQRKEPKELKKRKKHKDPKKRKDDADAKAG
ncbi:MAG: hypothetical protein NVS9B15_19110 [Acidobacteriaceae bacterium]